MRPSRARVSPAAVRPAARVLAAAVLVACAWVGARPGRAGAATVVSGAEYVGRLDAARTLALAGRASPSPERMREVCTRVGLPLAVVLGDDLQVDVARDDVLQRLEGTKAEDFQAAASHLGKLSAAAAGALAAPPPDGARMERALRGAYRGVDTTPTLRQRILRWFSVQFARVGELLSRRARQAPVLWTVLRWLAAALAIVVAGVAGLRLLRQIGLVPSGVGSGPRTPESRVDWERAADDALARGEAREAVRALYRLLVDALAERGLVPDLPSLTPAECRSSVRIRSDGRTGAGAAALTGAVDRATSAFERVVYGRAAASLADVEALREAGRAAGRAVRAA